MEIIISILDKPYKLYLKISNFMKENDLSFETQAQFLQSNLLENPTFFYVPENFDASNTTKNISDWLENKQERKTKISEIEGITVVDYQLKKGFKSSFGLAGSFQLFLYLNNNKFIYSVKPTKWLNDWNKKESSFSLKKFVQNSLDTEIENFIANSIIEKYYSDKKDYIISENNRYLEKITKKEKLWYYSVYKEDEILLAFLEISSVKKLPESKTVTNKLVWKYILTSKGSSLIALNSNFGVEEVFDISNKKMTIKKAITKDSVEVGSCQWFTYISNAKYYKEIEKYVNCEPAQRLYEFARQNWLYADKHAHAYKFTHSLLTLLLTVRDDKFDELTVFFIEFLHKQKDVVFDVFSKDEKLSTLINEIASDVDVEDKIMAWKNKWKLSTNHEITILKLILEFADNETKLSRLLQFHNVVRDKFLKLEKDKLNVIIFEIEYCKHLIACNKKEEATTILSKCLKEIPDETLSDLLPPKDVDITSQAGGQLLKVSLIELLAKASEGEKSVSQLKQITMLQPLSKQRLDNLLVVATGELKEKTQIIRKLLEPEFIGTADTTYEDVIYNELNEEEIELKLKHPAARKGAMFSSLQNWLASVKIPDYSIIKSYSEPLTSRKYPEISNIVTDIKVAFGIEGLETYIAHGDKSVGIRSYEGSPSFLIIGADHLDKESPYYLNFSEFEFIIGLEISHLYFKHSRITSSDVWRGTMEKSTIVLETILAVIPFVGGIGGAIKQIPKLSLVAKVIQNTEAISNITSKSVFVMEKTTQVVGLYKKLNKSDDKTEKKQELIAIARILQLTADRAGLMFTGDVKSAIRAIFFSSKAYTQEFDIVNRYGINKFLLNKDKEGNYKNQELAIRLASLLSFYLSDDYTNLRKSLIIEKQEKQNEEKDKEQSKDK